jgi:flagellar basal-body rod modification protein FlgD
VRIFDAGGRLVRTLIDGVVPPGVQAVVWDGRNDGGHPLGSGIYFYRVESPAGAASGKLVLAK